MQPLWLTRPQAREYIGRSDSQLGRWLADGMPHTRQPRVGTLIRSDVLEEFRDLMAARYRNGCGRPRKAGKRG